MTWELALFLVLGVALVVSVYWTQQWNMDKLALPR